MNDNSVCCKDNGSCNEIELVPTPKTNPVEDALKIVEEARRRDIEQCTQELNQLLKKYNCTLQWVETRANGQLVNGELMVRPRQ
jgi:hypothetical protein